MPNLDRVDHQVKVIVLPPECWVCGQRVHQKFLRKWNDDDVCNKCINDIFEGIDERSC